MAKAVKPIAANSSAEVVPQRFAIPNLRWVIAALLLLASVMNYVDRQALSILAPTIQAELGISDTGYARVVQAFLLTYTVMYLLSGRIVDRVGARLAETLFMLWWSVANILTGLASGILSLALFRSLLGMGEPGNYTASAKAVSEWFPSREKGVAVSLYTMGGTIGATIAAPLVAFLALRYGWRMAFVVTGVMGLLLSVIWFLVYRRAAEHPWLGVDERQMLAAEGVLGSTTQTGKALPWKRLLALKPVWVILISRMITDPVWYFYLFWFPKYMQEVRGYTLTEVGKSLWMVFVLADAGALLGGWVSGRLIRGGNLPVNARLKVMAGAAAVLSLSLTLPWLPGKTLPLLAASLFAGAHMFWMTNATTLPIDIFPSPIVGSVGGAIGTGSSLGGLISTGVVGYLVTNLSYTPVFIVMSFLHPLAFLLLMLVLPATVMKYQRTMQQES